MRQLRVFRAPLTAAAESAGWSRVSGGIHFSTGDRYGRELGEQVARKVWQRAHVYLTGNPADGGTR